MRRPLRRQKRVNTGDQSGPVRRQPPSGAAPGLASARRSGGAKRAFGRPEGINGSFVGSDRYRDQGEYTPTDQAPDPVLAEAFGRPYAGGDSLQRHPADAGAMDAERDGRTAEEPEDPWRDPGARPRRWAPRRCPNPLPRRAAVGMGKLGVRDVLFGGKVSYVALAILGVDRAGDRLRRRLGGPQDRRGRRGVHHVEGDPGDQRQLRATRPAGSPRSPRRWPIRW